MILALMASTVDSVCFKPSQVFSVQQESPLPSCKHDRVAEIWPFFALMCYGATVSNALGKIQGNDMDIFVFL